MIGVVLQKSHITFNLETKDSSISISSSSVGSIQALFASMAFSIAETIVFPLVVQPGKSG